MLDFHQLLKLYEEHLRGLRRSPSHIKNVRASAADLTRFCQQKAGITDPRQLEGKHLTDYILDIRQRSLGSTTIYTRQRTLRTWLAWATLRGHLLLDPFRNFYFKHPPHLQRGVPTVEQMQALLAAPATDFIGRRDHALLELLYGTGLRNGEVQWVDLEHLCLEKLELVVARGKGGKTRIVPIGPHLAEVLRDYLENVRPNFPNPDPKALFINRLGGRLSQAVVAVWVRRYTSQLGLHNCYPHAIRHAFATHLLQRGAPLVAVQRLLGHATLVMTQRYTNLLQMDLAAEIQRTHPRAKRSRRKSSPEGSK